MEITGDGESVPHPKFTPLDSGAQKQKESSHGNENEVERYY
jgi:hypothetical protein